MRKRAGDLNRKPTLVYFFKNTPTSQITYLSNNVFDEVKGGAGSERRQCKPEGLESEHLNRSGGWEKIRLTRQCVA